MSLAKCPSLALGGPCPQGALGGVPVWTGRAHLFVVLEVPQDRAVRGRSPGPSVGGTWWDGAPWGRQLQTSRQMLGCRWGAGGRAGCGRGPPWGQWCPCSGRGTQPAVPSLGAASGLSCVSCSALSGDRQSRLAGHDAPVPGPHRGQRHHQVGALQSTRGGTGSEGTQPPTWLTAAPAGPSGCRGRVGRAPGGLTRFLGLRLRFSMKRCSSAGGQDPGVSRSKTPGSPTPSLSADQAAGSPLLPLDAAGLSQGDVSHQDEAAASGAGRVDAQAKPTSKEPAPAPAPFVPFSGGGQRLGGPSGSAKSVVSPSAKLPKSFSSPGGPSKPKKSRPGQEPPPEPEPVRSGLGGGVLPPGH